jgi:hypothetical protein
MSPFNRDRQDLPLRLKRTWDNGPLRSTPSADSEEVRRNFKAQRTQVFISYSHQDKAWLERLQVHLKPLEREGMTIWDDTKLKPGSPWQDEIRQAIAVAKVAVLLISADFLASDFIAEKELPPLLKAAKAGGAVILPIIVSPSRFPKTTLAQFQAVNSLDEPLIDLSRSKREKILVEVSEAIEDALTNPLEPSPAETGTPPGRIWHVPPKLSRFFLGRDALLTQLHNTFAIHGAVALTGMGGIGKTQAALAYAHAQREHYRTVLWVSAASREDLVSGLVALAGVLKLPERDAKEQARTVSAVQRWLEHHGDWLLIVDNVDDLGLAKEFIPVTDQGRVLLTTRAQATRELAPPLPVEKLDTEFGGLFLLRCGGVIADAASIEAAPEDERVAAHTLAKELDGLPLALDQAGAYMEGNLTAAEYLDLYREQGKVLRAKRGGLSPDHPSVTVTFTIAFNKTLAVSPAAAELLRLCAFLDPTGIPEELFTEGHRELGTVLSEALAAPLGFVELRREACRLSLMARDRLNQLLMMHPVVQETLKDAMDEATQCQWAERAVRAVNQIFPAPEFANWPLCDRLLSQALRCAALIEAWKFEFEETGRLLGFTVYYLHYRARYAEAEPLYQRALAIIEKALGAEHPNVVQVKKNYAFLLSKMGRAVP